MNSFGHDLQESILVSFRFAIHPPSNNIEREPPKYLSIALDGILWILPV